MFQHVARIRFGIDDDHVGLQLRHPVRQMQIRRKHRDDVIAGLQQADRRYWRQIIDELKQLRAAGKLMPEGSAA